jgi:hypothetical protein
MAWERASMIAENGSSGSVAVVSGLGITVATGIFVERWFFRF